MDGYTNGETKGKNGQKMDKRMGKQRDTIP